MRRKSFESMACGIAQALELIGDLWSVLIIREALFGVTSFDVFHERLGMPRNTLAAKLAMLVENGLLSREDDPEDGRRKIYRLTTAGEDLWVVLLALQQWGHAHALGDGAPPSFIADRDNRRPVAPLTPESQSGAKLTLEDVTMIAGPGAPSELARRFEELP